MPYSFHAVHRRATNAIGPLVLALSLAGPAAAQLPTLSPSAPEAEAQDPTQPEEIEKRLGAVAMELEELEARLQGESGQAREHLEEVREGLRSIEALLHRQAAVRESLAGGTRDEATPLPSDDDPPSVFALNRLLDALREIEEQESLREELLAAARAALAAARDAFDKAEKERRSARAAVAEAENESQRRIAERSFTLRQLASRTAQERVQLRTLELREAEQGLEQAGDEQARIEAIDARLEALRAALAQGAGDPSAGFEELARRETELRRRRAATERRLASASLRLEASQQRFSRQADPGEKLFEQVESHAAERDAIAQELTLIDAQLERLDSRRTQWKRWAALVRGEARREELDEWKEAARARLGTEEQTRVQRDAQRADLERRLETAEERLESEGADPRLRSLLEQKRAALAELLVEMRREGEDLARDRRIAERYLADLREHSGELDLLSHVARLFGAARDVWEYEITAVEDSPITVGSVALALALFLAGLWASRMGSHFVGQVAEERFRLDAGAAHALQNLSFYVLLISFTLLALRAVHFPLTAFTVLGGALAIGIGFGSQNVMNNFISGLILMLERPVRAGDFVEIEANYGSIVKIGARSTQIRSVDGRFIVVPNSYFLESNVVNWTLSDDLIRTYVVVGVIYGSPTRLVEKLIQQAVDEDPDVIRHPEPVILFEEFGDNALNFEVHFWVRARSAMARKKVQSRIRFRIDDLFREHDLVIAFPQRDVHVDSVSPIEVRVVGGAEQNAADQRPDEVQEFRRPDPAGE